MKPAVGPHPLIQRIGAGSFGEVWTASSGDDGGVQAVKLHPAGGRALARFQREYLLLNRIDHPAVPVPHEFGALQEGGWFAMEFAPGLDALRYAQAFGAPGTPERTARVARLLVDLLSALQTVHRFAIHCDLKSSNLRVSPEGHLKILDFGGAVAVGAYSPLGRVYTSTNAALEQLAGGAVDARTDGYLVGAMAYRLLTGRRAFPKTEDAVAGRFRLPTAPHDLHPQIGSMLSDWTMALLAPAPADRPVPGDALQRLRDAGHVGAGWPPAAPMRAVAGLSDPLVRDAQRLFERAALSGAARVLRGGSVRRRERGSEDPPGRGLRSDPPCAPHGTRAS